ncbi:MAG: preprotein translocase subunit SecA [Parcubacteria group bacterium]|nr:preprotein translocase subunit SecA [Parcubacteria group bacterium]
MSLITKIFGDPNARFIKKIQPLIERANSFEPELEKLKDDEFPKKTLEFKTRLEKGETLDDFLPEAFALVREASKRTLGQRHFDVQMMGGVVLHQGKIAEMRTGEGKTLVATLPAYLNALSQKGVHVVTVNDYLARRDAVWMGQIYHFLGLTTACLNHEQSFLYDPAWQSEKKDEADKTRDIIGGFKVVESFLRPVQRREAYLADITYGTNSEFGFDYLRDNLVVSPDELVQRPFHFAIVDEVDSILIDEARTPLIISAPAEDAAALYKRFARIIPTLKENIDYNIDEKMKAAALTEEGINKIERALGMENIYEAETIRYVHHLEQALRAHTLFKRDRDYVIKDGEIFIVDEFTGRLMPGRRYSEGLHQAIEAKEGVEVQKESLTLATITIQNYFRMYQKLAGMTGTAATSAEEFHKVYKIEVVIIPTASPMIRVDRSDKVFQTENGKFKAIVQEIKERHEKGQPVLVGTVSIGKNEKLSALLSREGIPFQVLNAKNHEKEGMIISQAGKLGAVTVATNMAGRGVDIILGGNPPNKEEAEKVKSIGGLYVIGTERHEARRIDNQLRGRSGRQGDPGESTFFVSFEDDLMRIFAPDRIKNMMASFGIPEDQPIENRLVSKAIESAQGKIEGLNFDIRKHVLEFDDVMNKHRESIYRRRKEVLASDNLKEKISEMIEKTLRRLLDAHFQNRDADDWDTEEIFENIKTLFLPPDNFHGDLINLKEKGHREEIYDSIIALAKKSYEEKEQNMDLATLRQFEKMVSLRMTDELWVDHLENMEHLRDSVRLRAYGQRDPLVEYKNEGRRLYLQLEARIEAAIVEALFKLNIEKRSGGPRISAVAATNQPKVEFSTDKSKPNRNDPCPCGSGKKYKKCHGA